MSKTAVSFAFNTPSRLSDETVVRIRRVAADLGYSPHPVARMLRQRETRTIGILTPQALAVIFSNPFFATFSEGVAIAAEEFGYALYFISPLHGSLAGAMSRATVDGVVAIGLGDDAPEVDQVRGTGMPIVLVDSTTRADRGSVVVDDVEGARAAAEHLVALGHHRVLIIGVDSSAPRDPRNVTGRRLAGYLAAFEVARISIPGERFVLGPASIEGGFAAIEAAWPDHDAPTAILAMSDAMAIGAMQAVRARGLHIPDDVSIVGFDDLEMAQYVDPPLTTVHQPIRRKGEEAARLLLAMIQDREAARPRHLRLETRLVVRGSTGPPPRERRGDALRIG